MSSRSALIGCFVLCRLSPEVWIQGSPAAGVRLGEERGHELLAAEEEADFLPNVWLVPEQAQQLLREDDIAPGALLGHKLGREQVGNVDHADIGELLLVVGNQPRDVLDRDRPSIRLGEGAAPVDAGQHFGQQVDRLALPHAVDQLVDFGAIKRQLVRGLRQGISQFGSSKVAEVHVYGRSLVEQWVDGRWTLGDETKEVAGSQ